MSQAPGTKRTYRCVTVNIKVSSSPSVDLDPAPVRKKDKDEVIWECQEDPNFEVIFDKPEGSPFSSTHFNRVNNHSGPATKGEGTYKYTVKAGGGTLDPEIIVNQ